MQFGVRDICNVVFKAKAPMKFGNYEFQKGQPVLYIDTATASSLEQSVSTEYAQGGRGNARLIAWDGEKTLTFTVTDALMSPIGLAILSGAGLFKDAYGNEKVHVHTTTKTYVGSDGFIDLTDALGSDTICTTAPIFVMEVERGSIVSGVGDKITEVTKGKIEVGDEYKGKEVFVDYYILKAKEKVSELVIDAGHFAGNFYVEADTLFRDRESGKDLPAVITLPNVKIQSNFTFSMSSSGSPSTFDFTMDAMPGYTYFDRDIQAMCVIEILDDLNADNDNLHSVMYDKKDGETEPNVDQYFADAETDAGTGD